jgi:hypothetical protein
VLGGQGHGGPRRLLLLLLLHLLLLCLLLRRARFLRQRLVQTLQGAGAMVGGPIASSERGHSSTQPNAHPHPHPNHTHTSTTAHTTLPPA